MAGHHSSYVMQEEPERRRAFKVHWPNGKVGLVVCRSPLHLYEILEAESDITRCIVDEYKSDFCMMFDSETGIYTEEKPQSTTKPEPPTSLGCDLHRMKLAGDFCDVVLNVDDKLIACHKTVLAARSSYFKAMFSTQLKEGHQKEIKLQCFSHSVLDAVIEFLYTSELNLSNSTIDSSDQNFEGAIENDLYQLRDYLMAADFFDIPSLNACVQLEISKLYNSGLKVSGVSISYIRALIDLYETAADLRLRDLQKNIAACFPVDPVLHSMDLLPSLQEDITAAFLIDHNTPFYFGANHKLDELLNMGLLSQHSTLQDIARLEEEGADALKIFACHRLIDRACNNMLCHPDMSESIWQVIQYLLEKGSYPIDCLDHHGHSMLHIAAVSRQEELVARLLQAGADPHVTNAQGLTVIKEVKTTCNNDMAYFISQDLHTISDFRAEVAENPSRVVSMIDEHKELWIKARNTMRLLSNEPKSTLTYMEERNEQYRHCLEALKISLNDDFIAKAADKKMSGDATASLYAEGLRFMHVGGMFSSQFHRGMMSLLFRDFMYYMEFCRQQATSIEEATKAIRRLLTRDIAQLKSGQRNQLCSLQTLCELGFFTFPSPPANWWIFDAIVVLCTL